MHFPQAHFKAISNSIIISGIFRSGTTLMGKLIASFENIEYDFEPPLAFHLDFLLYQKQISPKTASQLLRTYLAENVMLNHLQGRAYNFRPQDDSCVFNSKAYSEVLARWQINGVQAAADLMTQKKIRLAFKIPATYNLLLALVEHYPQLKIIEIDRNLFDVANSIFIKNWLSDKNLTDDLYPPIWPFKKNKKLQIAYYAQEEANWQKMSLENRVLKLLNDVFAYKYKFISKIKTKYPRQILIIKYEDLTNHKNKIIKKINNFLKTKSSLHTQVLLKQIRKNSHKNIDYLKKNADPKIFKELIQNNKLIGY